MTDIIQQDGQDQLANGQSSRDFRVKSDVKGLEIQFDVNAAAPSSDAGLEEFPVPSASFSVLGCFRQKTVRLLSNSLLMSATQIRPGPSMEACCVTSLTQRWVLRTTPRFKLTRV